MRAALVPVLKNRCGRRPLRGSHRPWTLLRPALVALVSVFALGVATDAAACTYDSDCPVNVTCERDPGQVYGTCTGLPAAPPPSEESPSPPSSSPTPVQACVSPIDCEIGSWCQKNPGEAQGVCVK